MPVREIEDVSLLRPSFFFMLTFLAKIQYLKKLFCVCGGGGGGPQRYV